MLDINSLIQRALYLVAGYKFLKTQTAAVLESTKRPHRSSNKFCKAHISIDWVHACRNSLHNERSPPKATKNTQVLRKGFLSVLFETLQISGRQQSKQLYQLQCTGRGGELITLYKNVIHLTSCCRICRESVFIYSTLMLAITALNTRESIWVIRYLTSILHKENKGLAIFKRHSRWNFFIYLELRRTRDDQRFVWIL